MPEANQNDEEILDISAEDLDEPLPPVGSAQEDILVIEPEDLQDVRPLPRRTWSGAGYPARGQRSAPLKAGKGSLAGGLVSSMVLQMALAGAVGAFIAWIVQEPFITDSSNYRGPGGALAAMAGFAAVLGGLVGLALGSVEGIVSGVRGKAVQGGLLGLTIGGAGGALGGVLGQIAYGSMGGGLGPNTALQMSIRAFAWMVVGSFVGLGQGVMMQAPRKIVNGLIGGAIGGFVAGLLFDPLADVTRSAADSFGVTLGGDLSRMLGMTIMGSCAGAAIGLVEEMRKEAWLTIIGGPLTGKQFIIYRSPTVIGSSHKTDICLIKDIAVAPQHTSVEIEGNRYVLTDFAGAGTVLNGQAITRQVLQDGDNIQIGGTVLRYSTREALPPIE